MMNSIRMVIITSLITISTIYNGLCQKVRNEISNPYLALKTDSVVMYDYEGSSILLSDGNLVSFKNKLKLKRSHSIKFTKMVGDSSSYGKLTGDCWQPHLGVVYYVNGKSVAHIDICFFCNIVSSSLSIKANKSSNSDYMVRHFEGGMNKKFRVYLRNLLEKHKFSNLSPNNGISSIAEGD